MANYFLEKKSPIRSPKKLTAEAEKELLRYRFPGNVRELEHVIERAIIFSESNDIKAKDLNLTMNEFSFSEDVIGETDKILKLDNIEEKIQEIKKRG